MTVRNKHGRIHDVEMTQFELGLWRLNQRMMPFVGTVVLILTSFVAKVMWDDHNMVGKLEWRIEQVEEKLGIHHPQSVAARK